MTTTVKIEAHVASTKQVRVEILDSVGVIENFTLQDGQTAERYIYDDHRITVVEEDK